MPDYYHSIIKFLTEGGIFIIPIGIVLIIGLSVGLERWLFLTLERIRNKKALEQLIPILNSGKKQQMSAYTSENTASITHIIHCGLHMMTATNDREEIENALSEGTLNIVTKLKQRINYTAMLANVATLLGLLGTIIGLIGAFSVVASADATEKSRVLTESISVAMNTTAFGIIVAIPLLIIHAFLTNQSQNILTEVEAGSVKFLNIMTKLRLIETRSASTGFASPIPTHVDTITKIDTHQTHTHKTKSPPDELIENALSLDDDPEPPASIETTSIAPLEEAPIDIEPAMPTDSPHEALMEETEPEPEPEQPKVPVDPTSVATEKETIATTESAPTKTKSESTSSFIASPYLEKLLKSQAVDKSKAAQPAQPSSTEPSTELDTSEDQPTESTTPELIDPQTVELQIITPQIMEPKEIETNTPAPDIPEPTKDTISDNEKNTGKAVFSVSEPTNISLEEELRILELKKAEEQNKADDKD